MEFTQVIQERTATRKFSDKPIAQETLNNILNIGRLAPTSKNNQPQVIYVITSQEGLAKVDMASPCRYNAPAVLIICSDKTKAFTNNDYSSYETDACIVATHLMLAATNYQVDNIWIEMFDKKILKNVFNIPSNIEPICLLPLGYRAEDCPLNPLHQVRKELHEYVKYL